MRDEVRYRLRGWIPIPLYVLTLLTFDAGPASPAALLCGAALVLAGVGLRAWARVHIGRSSDTRKLHACRLVCTGPYGVIRNPLYAANIGIAAGLAVLIGAGAWTALLALLLVDHYHGVVCAEERMLESRFGPSFLEYRARVPRWWPLRGSRPERFDGTRREAWARLTREWRIASFVLVSVVLIVVVRS
jgi:protein-S-isoprenylcysteine O-methyltransferase Ste14